MRVRDKSLPGTGALAAPSPGTAPVPRGEARLARELLLGAATPLAAPTTPRAAADPGARATARITSALDGLAQALATHGTLDDALTHRFHAAARALAHAHAQVKPGQPEAQRAPVAQALEALRGDLLAATQAGPVDVEPPLRTAVEAFVDAYTPRAYDLGLPALGLAATGADQLRFLDAAQALTDVPRGTTAMPGAPRLALADGTTLVPGQFRQYQLDEPAVQAIVADVELPAGLIPFVGQDPGDAVPYVQIGIVGPDNYPHAKRSSNPDKLVYGRRWRVEPSLPDYEVVQTVFAAARDARDHEIREMLVVGGRTPFSGHVDAASLLAIEATGTAVPPANPAITTLAELQALLDTCRFGGHRLVALELEKRPRTGHLDVVFELRAPPGVDPIDFVDGQVLEARAEGPRTSDVLHGIMEELRRAALRDLEESFAYQGEVRFTRAKDPQFLGLVSALTRNPQHLLGGPVAAAGSAHTLAVEQARAPTLAAGPMTTRAVAALREHGPLVGIPPKV